MRTEDANAASAWQKNASKDEPLTWWDAMASLEGELSALDAAEKECSMFPDGMSPSDALAKIKLKKPSIRPYIAFNDLNNSKDEPNVNKPRPAIEVGIEVDF